MFIYFSITSVTIASKVLLESFNLIMSEKLILSKESQYFTIFNIFFCSNFLQGHSEQPLGKCFKEHSFQFQIAFTFDISFSLSLSNLSTHSHTHTTHAHTHVHHISLSLSKDYLSNSHSKTHR